MPIIGPILFSLFIFSPLFLPTSDADKNPEISSDSIVEDTSLPSEDSSPILETPNNEQPVSLAQ